MAYGASLVRRSVEWASATTEPGSEHPKLPKASIWAVLVIFLTLIAFLLLTSAIQYCIGGVVATLTIIETPQPDAYVAVDTLAPAEGPEEDGAPKPTQPLVEPEVLLLKNSAITTSIRRTITFLRARYGKLSPFRGLALFFCLMIARFCIIQLFGIPAFMNNFLGFAVASVIADMLLARWTMTWIHIVISEPSPLRWWRRAPALDTWTRIAPAMLVYSVATQISKILPVVVGMSFGVFKRMRHPEFEPHRREVNAALGQTFFVMFLIIALAVLVQLPASVIMIRVAASMLPEDAETVVPFDRSFGGKVTPAIVGGKGKIGMVEAWRSFEWAARARLLKLAAKVVVIMIALWIAFTGVMMAETYVIVGRENAKAVVGAISDWLNNGRH